MCDNNGMAIFAIQIGCDLEAFVYIVAESSPSPQCLGRVMTIVGARSHTHLRLLVFLLSKCSHVFLGVPGEERY